MAFERFRNDKPRFEVRLVLAAEQTIDGPAALFELWRAGDRAPLNVAPLGPLQHFDELVPGGLPRSEAKAARLVLERTRVREITAGGVQLYFDEVEVGFLPVGGTLKLYQEAPRPELAPFDTPAQASASRPVSDQTLGL
jgi:hypothetical protein